MDIERKDRYILPAIFQYNQDGISVEFPDVKGCFTCADTVEEALSNAKEALALHLYGMEQDNNPMPVSSSIRHINLNLKDNQIVMLVDVWMPVYRDAIENKAVKKTLTIPKWLEDIAEENKVNYSQLLQKALKEHLGVEDMRHA